MIVAYDKAGVTAFTGLVMGGLWVYRLYFPVDVAKPKSQDPKPCQEVLLLMMMFSSSVPLVVSGYLVRSLRFQSPRPMLSLDRPIPTIRLYPSPQVRDHIRTNHNLLDEIRETQTIPQTILQSGIQHFINPPTQSRDAAIQSELDGKRYGAGYLCALYTCNDRWGPDDWCCGTARGLGGVYGVY
jgi:hypothetical protein